MAQRKRTDVTKKRNKAKLNKAKQENKSNLLRALVVLVMIAFVFAGVKIIDYTSNQAVNEQNNQTDNDNIGVIDSSINEESVISKDKANIKKSEDEKIMEAEEEQFMVESGIFEDCIFDYYLDKTTINYDGVVSIDMMTTNIDKNISAIIIEILSCSDNFFEENNISPIDLNISITSDINGSITSETWKTY